MSFLRRVLARAHGVAGLQPPRAPSFARVVEDDAGVRPDFDVSDASASTRTPEARSSPLVMPGPAPVHDVGPRKADAPVVQETTPTASASVHTHSVERTERLVSQPSEPGTTVHQVSRPVAAPPSRHTIEVEHHHIHHDESRPSESHTPRVEHSERVVVQTTTPRPVPSDRARPAASARPLVAERASPVAAPRTVHVNIGRIVVSAESPAAKTQSPAVAAAGVASSARSLAEILAAKKGRS